MNDATATVVAGLAAATGGVVAAMVGYAGGAADTLVTHLAAVEQREVEKHGMGHALVGEATNPSRSVEDRQLLIEGAIAAGVEPAVATWLETYSARTLTDAAKAEADRAPLARKARDLLGSDQARLLVFEPGWSHTEIAHARGQGLWCHNIANLGTEVAYVGFSADDCKRDTHCGRPLEPGRVLSLQTKELQVWGGPDLNANGAAPRIKRQTILGITDCR